MKKVISLTVDKECGGARRYREQAEKGAETIGTLYVKRSSGLTKADAIRVTIETP